MVLLLKFIEILMVACGRYFLVKKNVYGLPGVGFVVEIHGLLFE